MFKRLRRSRLARAVAAAIAFVVIGYLSDAISAGACQRATDGWSSDRLAAIRSDWPQRRSSAGAAIRSDWSQRSSAERASFRLPWLLAVKYEIVYGPPGGEWGTRYYIGLLGIPIPIRNTIRMIACG